MASARAPGACSTAIALYIADVLRKVLNSLQKEIKADLAVARDASDRVTAETAFATFIETDTPNIPRRSKA
ncbi:MAG: hypothetical protein AAGB11_13785 [Pseudomonadota bacterium]